MISTRALGDLKVGAMGLGCMPMSGMPRERADILNRRDDALAVIHSALDRGITLLDTADIYCPSWDTFGHNEILVAEAVRSYPGDTSSVVIATKGGITRGPGEYWGRAANLDYLMRAAEASLGRLRQERIAIWQHHRLDPSLTLEEQFENIMVLKERGLIERIGVSNYNAEQLQRAIKIAGRGGIVSVQNQFSPKYRHDAEVIDICEQHQIAFLPWSPLGGVREAHHLGEKMSIFQTIGDERGESPQVIGLAWLLARSPAMLPIPGASRIESVADSLRALDLVLSADELARIDAGLPESAPVAAELSPAPPFRD